MIFTKAGVTAEADKKDMVVQYVDMELKDVWSSYPEFKDQTKSYINFKDAIIDHYPDASGEYLYSLHDIDVLNGECYRIGIRTLNDLIQFHNQFEAITSWLLDKNHIGTKERDRSYVGAFQPHLWNLIEGCLCITNPKQHPNLPYPVKDVFEAAKAVLQGPYIGARRPFANMTQVPEPQTSTSEAPTVNNGNPDPAIKMENFSAIISELISRSRNLSIRVVTAIPMGPLTETSPAICVEGSTTSETAISSTNTSQLANVAETSMGKLFYPQEPLYHMRSQALY